VRINVGGIIAVRHIPREQVVSISYGVSAAQRRSEELQARRNKLGTEGSVDEWWALARDAKQAGDTVLWRACVREVLARDRRNEEANRILNQVLYRGVWMRSDEMAIARGQIQFRGEWMGWNDKEQLLADESKRKIERIAQTEERRRAYAAAAAAAAAASNTSGLYPPTYIAPVYRAVFWPGASYHSGSCYSGSHYQRPILSLGASGGGSSFRWGFNWNL
jgi:hypothetical protein